MSRKHLALGLSAFVASVGALVSGGTANAADLYTLKIGTSFVISDACVTQDGKTQKSQIQIVVDDKGKDDMKTVAPASARIKVCSPFTSPVSQTMPLPLPVGMIKDIDRVAPGKASAIPFKVTKQMVDAFPAGNPPDKVVVTKRDSTTLVLQYVNSASGEVKIGPARVFVTPSENLASVPGFDENHHLPISRIEIDVPDKNVTLTATLQSVQEK